MEERQPNILTADFSSVSKRPGSIIRRWSTEYNIDDLKKVRFSGLNRQVWDFLPFGFGYREYCGRTREAIRDRKMNIDIRAYAEEDVSIMESELERIEEIVRSRRFDVGFANVVTTGVSLSPLIWYAYKTFFGD